MRIFSRLRIFFYFFIFEKTNIYIYIYTMDATVHFAKLVSYKPCEIYSGTPLL